MKREKKSRVIMSKLAQHKEEVRIFNGGKCNNYYKKNNIIMIITITITLSELTFSGFPLRLHGAPSL